MQLPTHLEPINECGSVPATGPNIYAGSDHSSPIICLNGEWPVKMLDHSITLWVVTIGRHIELANDITSTIVSQMGNIHPLGEIVGYL